MFRILSSFSLRSTSAVAAIFLCLSACRQEPVRVIHADSARYAADTTAIRKIIYAAAPLVHTNPDSARILYDSAYKRAVAVNDTSCISAALLGKAIGIMDTANYDLARRLFTESLQLALAVKKYNTAAKAAHGIGNSWLYAGREDSAVTHYLYSLDLFVKAGNPNGRAHSYNGLSIAFSHLGQIDKTLSYLVQAETCYRAARDTFNLVRSLHNQGMHGESVGKFREGYDFSKACGFAEGGFKCLLGMADLYILRNHSDSALVCLQQAAAVAAKEAFNDRLINDMNAVFGRLYTQQGNYVLAREYLLQSTRYASAMGNLPVMVKEYRALTEVNIHLGEKRESIASWEKYNAYRDSLLTVEAGESTSDLETKYRTAEKDAELVRNELELARQQLDIRGRNVGLMALSGTILLLVMGGGGYLLHIRQKQKLSAQKVLTLEREKELAGVQAAMEAAEKERARIARNLHDGAGSILSGVKLYLSSLENQYRELAGSAAYRDTLGLLNDAVTEIRETSHNLMPKMLHLEGIHAAIRDYCEKIGKSGHLEVAFQSYGEPSRFEIDFELMVFRTFQELLGNVMKHANARQVIVQLSFSPDTFTLTVEDDGQGLPEGDQSDGMGMFAINSRVEAYRGTMDVSSSADGTSITLEFPIPLALAYKSN